MSDAMRTSSVDHRVEMALNCLRYGGALGISLQMWIEAKKHLRLAYDDAVSTGHEGTLRLARILRQIDAEIARLSPPEAA